MIRRNAVRMTLCIMIWMFSHLGNYGGLRAWCLPTVGAKEESWGSLKERGPTGQWPTAGREPHFASEEQYAVLGQRGGIWGEGWACQSPGHVRRAKLTLGQGQPGRRLPIRGLGQAGTENFGTLIPTLGFLPGELGESCIFQNPSLRGSHVLPTSFGFVSSEKRSSISSNDTKLTLSLICHVLGEESTGWFNNHSGPSELHI